MHTTVKFKCFGKAVCPLPLWFVLIYTHIMYLDLSLCNHLDVLDSIPLVSKLKEVDVF